MEEETDGEKETHGHTNGRACMVTLHLRDSRPAEEAGL
jgi:hypothetical protein